MKPVEPADFMVPPGYVKRLLAPQIIDDARPLPCIVPDQESGFDPKTVVFIQVDDNEMKELQMNGGLIMLQILGPFMPQFSIDPV